MIVRPERAEDRPASIEVERAAFGQPLEADIVVAVRDEPGSVALVATEGDEIVGHVQLSTAWVGHDEVPALEAARETGACAVILLGSPAYYGARGFEPAAPFGLRNPFAGVVEDDFEIAEEDFQIAVLDQGRVAALSGDVRWHPAFG